MQSFATNEVAVPSIRPIYDVHVLGDGGDVTTDGYMAHNEVGVGRRVLRSVHGCSSFVLYCEPPSRDF